MRTSNPEESIFYAALERAANDRSAFVAQACGMDTQLRQKVEDLLSAYDEGEFLESPLASLATPALMQPIGEQPGDKIGPYKLLEEIGEGGMGLVFMADQTEPLRRRVALKIVKPGLDTRSVIARFEAERQALALMDHPNIARVYDAGTTELGRPYFAMELVRGVPITEYCRQHNVPLVERLNLFLDVCDAVQHAHQKGVIHRDLKPANILVTHSDTKPIPKVIDFGVAKAISQPLTDRTLFTNFAQLIGTPLYMSPEQADWGNQDIDTRSDVYSLGVVLYELLTGTTPFDADRLRKVGHNEMRRIIREEEPPKPSTRATTQAAALTTVELNRQSSPLPVTESELIGDLDWIAMKALEKDRRRRYQSPDALAADIRHFLDDEPVGAHPPTRAYKFLKFTRRNRIALLMTGAIGMAILLGLGASLWQAARATRAEHAANAAFTQARRAVDDMYTGVAEKWLEDQGTLTSVQRDLLEKALQFYAMLSGPEAATLEVSTEKVRTMLRVARIQRRLGKATEATTTYKHVLDVATRLSNEHPENSDLRIEIINARTELAGLYYDLANKEEAVKHAGLILVQAAVLKKAVPAGAHEREQLAKAMSNAARILNITNRREQSQEIIALALKCWQSLIDEKPSNFDYRYGMALAKARLGTQQMWWGTTDEQAMETLRQAEVLLTGLLKERPRDVACRRTLSSAVLNNLGTAHSRKNQHKEALDCDRRSAELCEGLAAEFPDDEKDQRAYLTSLLNLAQSLQHSEHGMTDDVFDLFKKAHQVAQDLARRYPETVEHKKFFLQSLIEVSRGLYVRGKQDETLKFHREALPQLARIVDAPGSDWNKSYAGDCLSLHAALEIDLGNHAAAAQLLEKYPFQRFDSDFDNPLSLTGGELRSAHVQDYEAQAFVLLKPAMFYERCASLATHDTDLTPSEQVRVADSYNRRADAYRQEGGRAIDAWVTALEIQGANGGFRAAYHGDNLIAEMLNFKNDPRTPPAWRLSQSATARVMVEKLVNKAVENLVGVPEQYLVAQLLVTAPAELRNDDLALRLAQRAVELAPERKEASMTLGWALFRKAEWQKCIDPLTKHSGDDSSGSKSVLAIALWQLNRKTEARKSLASAATEVAQFRGVYNEKLGQGIITMPTISMVQRLHEEANQLVTTGVAE